MSGKRIAYIDIAKGLLILCLLYGHMIIELNLHGVDDDIIHGMWKFVPVYNSFFMPCFFLITGLCTTFAIPFRVFLFKNLRTLILPAVLITLVGQYVTDIIHARRLSFDHIVSLYIWFGTGGWFIMALLLAKLVYWGLSRLKRSAAGAVVCLLYFGVLFLNRFDILPNFLWHRHAMMLMPFLFVGELMKMWMDKVDKYFGWMSLAWLILIPLQVYLHYRGVMSLPTLDKSILVTPDNFYVHFKKLKDQFANVKK